MLREPLLLLWLLLLLLLLLLLRQVRGAAYARSSLLARSPSVRRKVIKIILLESQPTRHAAAAGTRFD